MKNKPEKESRTIIYDWDFTLRKPRYTIVEDGKQEPYLLKPTKIKIGKDIYYKD